MDAMRQMYKKANEVLKQIGESTHPVCAPLDHPLFAFGGKRVAKNEELICHAEQSEASIVHHAFLRLDPSLRSG
jgi:hypothetical protein